MKYVRKPLLVDAIKYVGTNFNDVKKFCSIDMEDGTILEHCIQKDNQLYVINKGYITPVMTNEFIVKNKINAFQVYSPEVFNHFFEPANNNLEITQKFEQKVAEIPFQKERFEHKTNSAIDVSFMQEKYVVFKQQTFSVCFYMEQIEKLKLIIDKIYQSIQNNNNLSPVENDNDELINNSKVDPNLVLKSGEAVINVPKKKKSKSKEITGEATINVNKK